MNIETPPPTRSPDPPLAKAFTLVELLAVIAIIAVLATLLLSAISRSKSQAQSAACKNHLRQMGTAMAMYASETHHYPSLIERHNSGATFRAKDKPWAEAIYPYYPLSWKNSAWHCPRYVAQNGIIIPKFPMLSIFSSYSYNYRGIVGEGNFGPKPLPSNLGFGGLQTAAARDSEVLAPSEMYAVADSRWWAYKHYEEAGIVGNWNMSAWKYVYHLANRTVTHVETAPPHGAGYNIVFCDGHVSWVKRSDYLFPPRTARNWNRDNQPHPEGWAPRSDWVGQQ